MDTDRIEQSCIADIELLKKHTKGQTATYDLSIALDRSIRHRRRLIEQIGQLQALLRMSSGRGAK